MNWKSIFASVGLILAFNFPVNAQNEQKSFTFVQICDTQLGMGIYDYDVNSFRQAVKQVNALKPDFVVICGDLVNKASDSSFADFLQIKETFDMPCYVAPGNHDIKKVPTKTSLNYYRKTIGDDYYHFQNKGYSFIVTNSQLWKADVLHESKKHHQWFKKTLDAQSKKHPVIVVGHYPLFIQHPDEKEEYFNFPPGKRQELLDLFAQHNVLAYLSGHKHELLVNRYKNIQLVSGESTSRNFDRRPLGFRHWQVSNDTISHHFVPVEPIVEGNTVKLMTYNLKFASPTFEPPWEVRRKMQVNIIRKYSPDIIGTQEGLKEQVDDLMDRLPEYVVIGEGRKAGDDDEHMAIFFKRDKFRLREMGSFQLSETPEVIGSGPEVNPRMVTWARLAIINRPPEGESSPYPSDYRGHWENTKEFYVFNTHFFTRRGHDLEQLNSAKLIMDRINSLNRFGSWTKERPVFLMGDFNARPGGEVYKTFVGKEGSDDSQLMEDSIEGGLGIDWILSKGNVKVLYYEKVDYNVDGVYPSDHKPVFVDYQMLDK